MRLFLLSILAIGSVQSHAIGSTGVSSAYRSGLLAYNPARGEFPVQSTLAKGYLRYIDGSGAEQLETYWYPEPLNGVRQLKHNSAEIANPLVQPSHQQHFLQLDSGDVWRTREEYFRVWCEQRFRDLHAEIDRLRAAGIIPPVEMLEQLEPLQKVLHVPTTATSETIEVQQAGKEHLGIWNEARLRALYAQHLKPLVVPSFQLRSSAVDAKETNPTAEKLREKEPVIRTEPQSIYQGAPVRLSPSGVVLETPEVMQAREEHLRLYNEAKLRAENAGHESEGIKTVAGAVKQLAENAQSGVRQSEQQVVAAPETPANVEHLKLVKQVGASGQVKSSNKHESVFMQEHPLGVPLQQLAVGLRSVAGFDAPTEQQLRVVEETPEVKRAREEHLSLKKAQEEAFASQFNIEQGQQFGKTETVQKTLAQPSPAFSQTHTQANQLSIGLRTTGANEQVVLNQLGHIEDTREVKRAREEHLRLVEEAKLRATQYQTTNAVKSETTIPIRIAIADGANTIQQAEIQRNEEARMEVERIREEELLREEERLRDEKRLEEEQRYLEAELLRQRQEEEQRKQSEMLAEEQRLKEEEVLLKAAEKSEQIEKQNQINTEIVGQIRTDIQGSFSHNPYLVQLASPSGVGTNYLIAGQPSTPQQAATVRYYLPAGTAGSKSQVIFNQANPFLQSYTLENRPKWLREQVETTKLIKPQTQALVDERQVGSVQLEAYNAGQQQVESSVEALSELERATREHFRAHEIALEQLRLAKLRNPDYKDCN